IKSTEEPIQFRLSAGKVQLATAQVDVAAEEVGTLNSQSKTTILALALVVVSLFLVIMIRRQSKIFVQEYADYLCVNVNFT
ncbi:hypothetical protein F2Y95_24825, partial [Aphanizomenon flos-aquae CCAP 1446/1C]|nr:hypothetical protein [Anabaena sp. CCAP 1446/1C]MBY5307659.1 hypothetical protein [Anabaena sp. CCAP 1446/1C]